MLDQARQARAGIIAGIGVGDLIRMVEAVDLDQRSVVLPLEPVVLREGDVEVLELERELAEIVLGPAADHQRLPAGRPAVAASGELGERAAAEIVEPARARGFDDQPGVKPDLLMIGRPEMVVGEHRLERLVESVAGGEIARLLGVGIPALDGGLPADPGALAGKPWMRFGDRAGPGRNARIARAAGRAADAVVGRADRLDARHAPLPPPEYRPRS